MKTQGTTDLEVAIIKELPYLRRYARALTGSRERSDSCVADFLRLLGREPSRVRADTNIRLTLFRLFTKFANGLEEVPEPKAGSVIHIDDLLKTRIRERVSDLIKLERQALLLVRIEGFAISDAANILAISEDKVQRALDHALDELKRQEPVEVLVIEDEPVIALDIAQMVTEMGHRVVGVAHDSKQAIEMARLRKPKLILADIQLTDGNTGIGAVRQILTNASVPVVFVTAFPERLLTGKGIEPRFLVTKPFDADTLLVTISQALFCAKPASDGRDRARSA